MQTRILGNSDLNITLVGYGAWAVGGSGWQFAWGSQDDDDSIAAIHRALELGVTGSIPLLSTVWDTPKRSSPVR